MDVVVYHKHDYRSNQEPVLQPMGVIHHLLHQELCGRASPVGASLHYPNMQDLSCRIGCQCGRRPAAERPVLRYFTTVPNYGVTHRKPFGGSREPYAFLQYLLDFWDNLPPVSIFTQDDCLVRGCHWGMQLPGLRHRLLHWHDEWGLAQHRPIPINSRNCLCKVFKETNFASRGYFWYRWMSFAQEHLFGTNPENRSTHVRWPQDATFAVSRYIVRSQPRWRNEALLRITTVESACIGPTIMWAHSLERLWFELLDGGVPKDIHLGRRGQGACFLGARRRS